MKKLPYDLYMDRILGGWYAKSIGGVTATQVEGVREWMDFKENQVWPKVHPANDDLTMQVMFLEVLEEQGVYLTQMDLARAWIERCWYPYGEYGYFRRNWKKGIRPPASAGFDNPIKEHGMGCPIRSEIWAMICPGDPELARRLCRLEGTIDHAEQSVAGEEMWSGLQSELFFERDTRNLRKLIDRHRRRLPEGSKIADTVELAIHLFDQGIGPREARRRVLARLAEPDASDARLNVGLTVMALLYGGGNFKKTALLAMNLGHDTDCTGATALAVLGMISGYRGLPKDWVRKNGPEYVCDLDIRTRDDRSLHHVAERTVRAGLAMTRTRSKACRITGAPGDLKLIPTKRPAPCLDLDWDYRGMPSMAIGDAREMAVVVKNPTSQAVSGKLTIRGPRGWKISLAAERVAVKARGRRTVPVQIEIPGRLKEISQGNPMRVRFEPRRGKALNREFGISGAWPWQVLGLFFDSYDRVKFPRVTWDRGRWGSKYPRGMRGHFFVDLNIPYVNEGRFNYRKLVRDGQDLLGERATVHAHTVEIPADEVTRMNGEFCVYLLGNVVSDVARKILLGLGNNDAIKVWVNGKLAVEADDKQAFVPMDRQVRVRLRKGLNRVVVKALRRSDQLRLAAAFREPKNGKYRGCQDWTWDLKWRVE